MKNFLIVDIDGTLANVNHRIHLANSGEWEDFHAACANDKPYEDIIKLVSHLSQSLFVVALTTRPEKYRPATMQWLATHNLYIDDLLMRPVDDWRNDVDVKIELLEKYFGGKEKVLEKVLAAIEDREKIILALRNYGLTVLAPREGGY